MAETRRLHIPVDINPVELIGNHDRYLRMIEDSFRSSVVVRGNEVIISGNKESVEMAVSAFKELLRILDSGKSLNETIVEEVLRIILEGEDVLPSDIFSDVILVHRGKP